jgi:phosphoglucomutase
MNKMIMSRFKQWFEFDNEIRHELEAIQDEQEIADRFYRDLEFGTGGLRGVMGAGTNRMNRYTVRRATLGLARFLISAGERRRRGETRVAIAYDSRNHSREFALEAASVLCAAGIAVSIFDQLMPTPVLSFTVRHLGCQAGIVITASHNPKEYNGYKVYDATGCQILPDTAALIIAEIGAISDLQGIPTLAQQNAEQIGLLTWIGDDVLTAYLANVREQSLFKKQSDLKVVYTPLHGTGNVPVRRILDRFIVEVIKSQELPDGDFSTVRSPNPEERDALMLAIEEAQKQGADLVLGTDPDCDRVGVAVRQKGDYVLLTGNQIGALLVDFVVKNRVRYASALLTKGIIPVLVKTIVTNELGAQIGQKNGLQVDETLTGFKYIGDKINQYQLAGDKSFVIGYEESFGFLVGTHARDKDAVVASLLIVEMAAWHREQGRTLIDALVELFVEYGYYLDALDSFTLKGAEGAQRIQVIMQEIRKLGSNLFADSIVTAVKDYEVGVDGLPRENVVKFILNDGSWMAIRPSGTEPKVKIYYSVKGEDKAEAEARLQDYREIFRSIVG